jgi:hypothetical protein
MIKIVNYYTDDPFGKMGIFSPEYMVRKPKPPSFLVFDYKSKKEVSYNGGKNK